MRVKNSSGLLVPKRLWQKLASAMRVGGTLPGAVSDDLGLYSCRTLRLTIRRERDVPAGEVVTTGSYTYGHIILSPCVHCTPAFLTQVYLHELAHAWLHQFHSALYDRVDSCPVAERFASAGFRVLGGQLRKVALCGSYSLPSKTTLARLCEFGTLAKSLTEVPAAAVETWRPGPTGRQRVRLEG